MTLYISFFLVAFLSVAIVVDCKKKTPSGIRDHQYCHGCMATIKELQKKISKNLKSAGNRDVAVIESMEDICQPKNFVTYNYSPPKTMKACQVLLEHFEEVIETTLIKDYKRDDMVSLICNKITGACDGVDLEDSNAKFSDIDLTKGDGSQTVKFDASTGKTVLEEKEKEENKGKTSESDKKMEEKKEKEQPVKDSKTKDTESGGEQKDKPKDEL